MKKISLIIGITVILLAVASIGLFWMDNENNSVTGQVTAKALENVNIGYREHLLYLPAYVAEAEGFFAEEGLDAKLIPFQSTNQLVEAVINGNLDAGVGGVNVLIPMIIETKTPGLLKIFSQGILSKDFDALIVGIDSGIENIQDLEGKTISSFPGSTGVRWMNIMLEKEGLTGKVDIIQTNPSEQINVLASGSADAVFVMEPLVSLAEAKGIGRVLVDSPIGNYFMEDMLWETSVMSTKFIDDNPETAQKIINAVNKAIDFINSNPDEAREYYSEFTPADDELESRLPVCKYFRSDKIDSDKVQELADKLYAEEFLSESVEVEGLLI